MKADPRLIVKAHRATYVDAQTKRISPVDVIWLEGLPVVVGLACLWRDVVLPEEVAVGLLTVAGLLSALFFGVMNQVADRAMQFADSAPEPNEETTHHAESLRQLSANSGYASIVCIATCLANTAAAFTGGWLGRMSSAVAIGLGVHLVLVLFMILRRVYALTNERVVRASTGADRRPR